MTYSGLLMVVICSTAARLLYERRDWIWPALVMPALVVALALTFTRSAWVGACVGVGLLLLMRDLRLFGVLPVVAALFFALAPAAITDAPYSMFNLHDPSNRDRLAMMQAGTAIVKHYPLTGVGPNVIPKIYPAYRTAAAVEQTPPHLHNVPLQIAAERGLPALGVGLVRRGTAVGALAAIPQDRARYLAAAGLGALAADAGGRPVRVQFRGLGVPADPAHRADASVGGGPRSRPGPCRVAMFSTLDRLHLIDAFSSATVLIVGDVMLDQFVVGRVNRISPEAPVPVIEYRPRRLPTGGAANVAHNVRALGGASTRRPTGSDAAGRGSAGCWRPAASARPASSRIRRGGRRRNCGL